MSKYNFPLYIVNAFTKDPFRGNPAAVCLIDKNQEPSDELKQQLATEMDLSETAFVMTKTNNDNFKKTQSFGLRWFTPVSEVPLCGHATLASAAVLFYCVGNNSPFITFDTLSGPLTVKNLDNHGKIIMEFPDGKTKEQNKEDIKDLVTIATGSLPYKDIRYSSDKRMYLFRLEDTVQRSQFESYSPSPDLLLQAHCNKDVIGIIVTMKGSAENGCISDDGTVYDYVCRFFAPWFGTPEDPVTGSAHTVLGPYWAEILNKKQLFACQCSKRKGELWLDMSKEGIVQITGNTFIFVTGSTCIH